MEISERPSPNFGERAGGLSPSLVVLHYTAMASAQDATTSETLVRGRLEVSRDVPPATTGPKLAASPVEVKAYVASRPRSG